MSRASGWGITFLVLVAAAAPAGASDLERLERALAGVDGLRADFVQIRDVSLSGESLSARGSLAFLPPARFRLAYAPPDNQELVVDGDSLWVMMPAERQVQRYPFSAEAPGSEIFLLFGGRARKLSEAFRVIEEPWGTYPNALRLFPREDDPGYPLEEIRLVVGANGFPERLFYREVTGDTVIFTFTRIVRNPKDILDRVTLRIPAGFDIIDMSPPSSTEGLPIDPRQ